MATWAFSNVLLKSCGKMALGWEYWLQLQLYWLYTDLFCIFLFNIHHISSVESQRNKSDPVLYLNNWVQWTQKDMSRETFDSRVIPSMTLNLESPIWLYRHVLLPFPWSTASQGNRYLLQALWFLFPEWQLFPALTFRIYACSPWHLLSLWVMGLLHPMSPWHLWDQSHLFHDKY